jgi:hypothetical protein
MSTTRTSISATRVSSPAACTDVLCISIAGAHSGATTDQHLTSVYRVQTTRTMKVCLMSLRQSWQRRADYD